MRILGQYIYINKTFSDGTAVKECLHAVVDTLFEGNQKEEMCGKKIKEIQTSASTATRESEILAKYGLAELGAAIQSFSLLDSFRHPGQLQGPGDPTAEGNPDQAKTTSPKSRTRRRERTEIKTRAADLRNNV